MRRAMESSGCGGSGGRGSCRAASLLASGHLRLGRSLALPICFVVAAMWLLDPGTALAQDSPNRPAAIELPGGLGGPEQWASPEGLTSAIQVMLLLTVISLAPAVLLMTTCFVRIIVVLGVLRQALGTQQLSPSQVITSIA